MDMDAGALSPNKQVNPTLDLMQQNGFVEFYLKSINYSVFRPAEVWKELQAQVDKLSEA